MLYNKVNVYGLEQENEIEFWKSNIVYLYKKDKVITLRWRADIKDWVDF